MDYQRLVQLAAEFEAAAVPSFADALESLSNPDEYRAAQEEYRQYRTKRQQYWTEQLAALQVNQPRSSVIINKI